MTTKVRMLLIAGLTAILGLTFGGSAFAQVVSDLPGMGTADQNTGGGLEAAAVDELGNTEHGPCVEDLMDLPALEACKDAAGRVIMDLPALKLVGPAGVAHHKAPRALPETGLNVGDFAAVGGAAFAAGVAMLRRVRLALAS